MPYGLFDYIPDSQIHTMGLVQKTPPPQFAACAQDVKKCPDGSYVSRVLPKCDFAPCPPPCAKTYRVGNCRYTLSL